MKLYEKIILAIILAALFSICCYRIGYTEDLSTWRYGSPSDFKRMANYLMQNNGNDRRGYGRGGSRGGGLAAVTVFDTLFRAGSPDLYRKTQPQAPQTNINVYIYNSNNETPQYIVAPKREREVVSGRTPKYPAGLMP